MNLGIFSLCICIARTLAAERKSSLDRPANVKPLLSDRGHRTTIFMDIKTGNGYWAGTACDVGLTLHYKKDNNETWKNVESGPRATDKDFESGNDDIYEFSTASYDIPIAMTLALTKCSWYSLFGVSNWYPHTVEMYGADRKYVDTFNFGGGDPVKCCGFDNIDPEAWRIQSLDETTAGEYRKKVMGDSMFFGWIGGFNSQTRYARSVLPRPVQPLSGAEKQIPVQPIPVAITQTPWKPKPVAKPQETAQPTNLGYNSQKPWRVEARALRDSKGQQVIGSVHIIMIVLSTVIYLL